MNRKSASIAAAFFAVFSLHAGYLYLSYSAVAGQWVQVEEVSWLSSYIDAQDYFLGLSYALAASFTVYALFELLSGRKGGTAGVVGGLTLTGALYFGVCFLLGCCGSPMLYVYVGLFGSSYLGVAKPLVFIVTAVSIAIGAVWLKRRSKRCCAADCEDSD